MKNIASPLDFIEHGVDDVDVEGIEGASPYKLYPLPYAVPLLSRLKDYFDDIVVLNYHDDSRDDLLERFYCQAVPDASRTCQAVRDSTYLKVYNSRRDLIYDDLAGIVDIRTKEQFKTFVESARKFQESTLGLRSKDFKMKCLSDEKAQLLLNVSLQAEAKLFPEFFKGPSGEASLRSDFEKKRVANGLCEVDAKSVFAEPQWRAFLSSLNSSTARRVRRWR
jgi:hypothetical protein